MGGCARAGFYAHFVPYYFSGARARAKCGEGPGFKYCLHSAPSGDNDPRSILYFLHYAGGSELTWSSVPISRVYYSEFKRRGLKAPRVVTVSYGPYWTLFDRPGPKSPEGKFAPFVGSAMPWIEKEVGGVDRRYIWGMSQGGLNASELVLRRPDLWSGAVFACPGWFTIDVFAGASTVAEFVARNSADRGTTEWGMALIRDRVAGPDEWKREDPLTRAISARDLPPIYIDSTREDQFGFHEGARLMSSRLKEAGQRVEFAEHSGRHCALDARKISSFLAGLVADANGHGRP